MLEQATESSYHCSLHLRRWMEVMFSPLFVSVCLSVCLSVNSTSQKVVDRFGRNLGDTLGVWHGRIDSISVKIRPFVGSCQRFSEDSEKSPVGTRLWERSFTPLVHESWPFTKKEVEILSSISHLLKPTNEDNNQLEIANPLLEKHSSYLVLYNLREFD